MTDAVAEPVAADATATPDVPNAAPDTGAVVVPAPDAAPAAPAVEVAKEVVYDLKIPEGSPLDPAALERTVAIARERGLSAEQAQAMVDLASKEAVATRDATLAAIQPGGAEWTKQVTAWEAASLADPELGAGKPEVLAQKATAAKSALDKFGSKEFVAFLDQSGFGSHPEVVRIFARIAAASAEPTFTVPGSQAAGSGDGVRQMYPSMYEPK